MTSGVLYLVATPIGNPDDITLRAIKVLKECDIVVYEERREGSRLLAQYDIEKPVESLNEHNERAATEIILGYLRQGKSVALVSDAGTPVFSDPGRLLVQKAIHSNVRIVPIPGASSLMPALIASGFPIEKFSFVGFLSPKRNRRKAELRQLKNETNTLVLMDAPYRLTQVLRDIADDIGPKRRLCVAFDMTLPTEEFIYGEAEELYKSMLARPKKGEFVIIIDGMKR